MISTPVEFILSYCSAATLLLEYVCVCVWEYGRAGTRSLPKIEDGAFFIYIKIAFYHLLECCTNVLDVSVANWSSFSGVSFLLLLSSSFFVDVVVVVVVVASCMCMK